MADRGDLPPDAQIRRGRDGKWVRADSVKGLKFVLKPTIDSFRVKGPDLQTGRMREVTIVAATQDEAHRIAAEAGVVTGTAHDAVTPAQHIQEQAALPAPAPTTPMKYPAMSVIVGCYRLLAVICGLAAAIGVVIGGITASNYAMIGVAVMIGSAVWGALTVVSLLALAEGISLMIDIEYALRQIRDRLPGS